MRQNQKIMKVQLLKNSHANITFNTNAKVTIRGEQSYLVKWYRDEEYIGEMEIGSGNWGAFPNEIGNWLIEFYQTNNLIKSINFNLYHKNILILPIFNTNKVGKNIDLNPLQKYIEHIEEKYKCNAYICFKHSERFDTGLKTIKMNDNLDFSIIIEQQF